MPAALNPLGAARPDGRHPMYLLLKGVKNYSLMRETLQFHRCDPPQAQAVGNPPQKY
jgi:hypothetical protein